MDSGTAEVVAPDAHQPLPALRIVRQPLSHHNQLIEREREAFGEVTKALEKVREARDSGYERAFDLLFAQPEAFAKLIQGMGGTVGQQPKT